MRRAASESTTSWLTERGRASPAGWACVEERACMKSSLAARYTGQPRNEDIWFSPQFAHNQGRLQPFAECSKLHFTHLRGAWQPIDVWWKRWQLWHCRTELVPLSGTTLIFKYMRESRSRIFLDMWFSGSSTRKRGWYTLRSPWPFDICLTCITRNPRSVRSSLISSGSVARGSPRSTTLIVFWLGERPMRNPKRFSLNAPQMAS